jgi:proline racemase
MAVLHARGLMGVSDATTHASVLGTTFDGRIVEETRVGEHAAIVPAIRGSAWITGISQVFVDPDDPFPEGYVLPDTWGVGGLDAQ